MTPSDLKYLHDQFCAEHKMPCHFFSRKAMAFFGDTMRNFGVRKGMIAYADGSDPVEGWILYRKRPVKHGLQSDHCFTLDGMATMRKPID